MLTQFFECTYMTASFAALAGRVLLSACRAYLNPLHYCENDDKNVLGVRLLPPQLVARQRRLERH